jgi:hypothetical protein
MKRFTGRVRGRDIVGQLQLTWSGLTSTLATNTPAPPPAETPPPTSQSPPPAIGDLPVARPTPPRGDGLTLLLKWDFSSTFPSPIEEAIEAGRIQPEDAEPENVRSIHQEHAREMVAMLHDLEAVQDARRRGVDPRNNKAPMLAEAKEQLRKFFETEPVRLERNYQSLLAVYGEVFGDEAADAFDKAVRAWHAGVAVAAESRPHQKTQAPPQTETDRQRPVGSAAPPAPRRPRGNSPHRVTARLPVPRPLASAISAGHFGQEENGKPVHPGPREIRESTLQHADNLVELLDAIAIAPADHKDDLRTQFAAGIGAYAEDFGPDAAQQLEAYVRRQATHAVGSRRGR